MQKLEELLTIKMNLPIKMTKPFSAPVLSDIRKRCFGNDQYVSSKINRLAYYKNLFYLDVFRWLPGNPSKPELGTAIKEVYHFLDSNNGTYNMVNTANGHKQFLRDLVSDSVRVLLLIGKKGSGKTFYLNYLINTQTDELYKNKTIWYRVDVSKLYHENLRLQKEAVKAKKDNYMQFGLKDYLSIHIPYVTFKYRESHQIWNNIWDDENQEFGKHLINRYNIQNVPVSKPDEILADWKIFIDRWRKEEAETSVEHSRNFYKIDKDKIRYLLKDSERLIQGRLLYESILSYLVENNFNIIFIIDGLDNIDFHRSKPLYDHISQEVADFCLKGEKPLEFGSKIILSVRDETKQDLLSKEHLSYGEGAISEYRVAPVLPTKLIRHKLTVASDPKSKYYQRKKLEVEKTLKYMDPKELGLDDIEKELSLNILRHGNEADEFIKVYTDALKRHIKSIDKTIQPDKAEEWIMETYFNDNVRDLLFNFVNAFNYTILYKHSKKRTRFSSYTAADEGSFLNGQLWLCSDELKEANTKRTFGHFVQNIFWFDNDKADSHWHGFCLYRILQYLNKEHRQNRMNIYRFMKNKFSYNIDIIDERFESAIAYGLISCVYHSDEKKLEYRLTGKGEFFLEYPFSNVDHFYYMALDTPIPEDYHTMSKYVRFHVNDGDSLWQNYTEACIITSITFARLLNAQHKLEMGKISDVLKSDFSLPECFPTKLIEGMKNRIYPLADINRERHDNLLNDINGLI